MNARQQFSWAAIDRAHEAADMADEDFDMAVAAAARRHAAAVRQNCAAGHEQTLGTVAESWAHLVSQPGVTEQLVRITFAQGPLAAGHALAALFNQAIEADAEVEGLKEAERACH